MSLVWGCSRPSAHAAQLCFKAGSVKTGLPDGCWKHSWAACAEGLEHPHTKDIRPITFDHAAADGRDDIVLVHLNHRLVQMSLRLLRAEVWSVKGRKRLHRITARIVPDTALQHLAMIAHARLVVIGGDCHRLHEEIITAGGMLREGRFARLGS